MAESLAGKLTPKEIECMRGVAEYKRTAQIAADTGLSDKTVDAYIANVSRKLGVGDRNTAIRMLIDDDPTFWGKSPLANSGLPDPDPQDAGSWLTRLPWPWPTRRRPSNDLSSTETIAAILIAATFLLAAASLYLLAFRMLAEPI